MSTRAIFNSRARRRGGLRRDALLHVSLTALLCLSAGCGQTSYLARQAIGQAGVLIRSVPIEDALQSGRLSDEQAAKLRLIVDVREYARERLGLRVRSSFRKYHDTGGKPMAYNLSACRKDSLTPKRWWFPVIGWIDYIGYFDRADAKRAERELRKQGYDTLLRDVDAFSSLGWLPDPVHSPLLKRDEMSLVDVVIHELAHNTVYANGQSDFNESLATFVGRRGAIQYYTDRGKPDRVALLRQRYEDSDRINVWLAEFQKSLTAYYAGDATRAQKLAGREALFQAARDRFTVKVSPRLHDQERMRGWGRLPTNNAWVRLHMRYNKRQELFAQVYKQAGGTMKPFLDHLRSAARSDRPFEKLEQIAGLR